MLTTGDELFKTNRFPFKIKPSVLFQRLGSGLEILVLYWFYSHVQGNYNETTSIWPCCWWMVIARIAREVDREAVTGDVVVSKWKSQHDNILFYLRSTVMYRLYIEENSNWILFSPTKKWNCDDFKSWFAYLFHSVKNNCKSISTFLIKSSL